MGGVRKQILLTEKSQVLYKDTPPSRMWNRILPTPHRLTWGLASREQKYGKGKTGTLPWRNLTDTTLTKCSELTHKAD